MSHDGNGNTNLIGSAGFAYTAENLLGIGGGRYFQSDSEGRTRYVHTPDWSSYRGMIHAGTEIIHEFGSGGLSRRYVHGAGVDEPLVAYDGTNLATRHWLHADERGSIVAQSDGTGAATSINRYDDYGAPASTNTGLFQYTGRPYIPEIGMYDYRARMYNPGTMGSPRFMQPDPIGYRAGMNLYGYVGGDPVNFTDPTGLLCTAADAAAGRCLPDITVTGTRPKPTESYFSEIVEFMQRAGNTRGPEEDGGEIIVTGTRAKHSATKAASTGPRTYAGCTWGYGPTHGRERDPYYPDGRINSGRPGDFDQALADIDSIAQLNGVTPLGSLSALAPVMAQLGVAGILGINSLPVGSGWEGSRNPNTGYVTFRNYSGLSFRFNPGTADVRVEIPDGFRLPGGRTYNGGVPEVCHYPR